MQRQPGAALRFSAATLLLLSLLSGCTSVSENTDSTRGISCDEMLSTTISLIRAGEKGNGDDALTDSIVSLSADYCAEQYGVFADYSSGRAMAGATGPDSCRELAGYIRTAAIRLLRQDGLCRGRGGQARPGDPGEEVQTGGGISWGQAREYVGTHQRVCGPLSGTGNSADDVFLNIGRNYPDPNRFTIVLWDVGGVETLPSGTTVCATGLITLYEGVAQIQLRSLSAVEVQR